MILEVKEPLASVIRGIVRDVKAHAITANDGNREAAEHGKAMLSTIGGLVESAIQTELALMQSHNISFGAAEIEEYRNHIRAKGEKAFHVNDSIECFEETLPN